VFIGGKIVFSPDFRPAVFLKELENRDTPRASEGKWGQCANLDKRASKNHVFGFAFYRERTRKKLKNCRNGSRSERPGFQTLKSCRDGGIEVSSRTSLLPPVRLFQ
jgi:hypothetical protein